MANVTTKKKRKPGPGLWLSLIIAGLGLFAASWGAWQAYNTALDTITAPAFDIPGSGTRDLAAGDYEIYVRTGSAFNFELTDTASLPSLDEITVTEVATGETVPIQQLFLVEPAIRGTNRYDSVAEFTVQTNGSYRVDIDSNSTANRAVFARSFDTGLEHAIPWAIVTGVGSLVMLLGSIMLIVGLVRRSRDKKVETPASGSWQQPPGMPLPLGTPQPTVPPRPPSIRPVATPAPPPPTRSETHTPWDD